MAKKLLDQLSGALRTKHYSYPTEVTYIDWVRRFFLFHNKHHPETMGAAETRAFLAYLPIRCVYYQAKACGASPDRSGRPRLMLKSSFNLSR